MSTIGYREWQIWSNADFFESCDDVFGIVYFKIVPSLMAEQTVSFVYEKIIEFRNTQYQYDDIQLRDYFNFNWISPSNELVIQKISSISLTSDSVKDFIQTSLSELDAISLCLDFPMTCNEIRFTVPSGQPVHGDVFFASRKPIGRGLSFHFEERELASLRLANDFSKLKNLNPTQKVAARHYLNGLTILGLEDQFSGLIDAAFMQFYQACEVLCGGNFKLSMVKRYIASNYMQESMFLQLAAHHVWQIRHNYFGHGNVDSNIANLGGIDMTFMVAKQVLVARWLCKRLFDLNTNSNPLEREMRLFHKSGSVKFSGDLRSLVNEFYIGYEHKNVKVLDSNGHVVETVDLSQNI